MLTNGNQPHCKASGPALLLSFVLLIVACAWTNPFRTEASSGEQKTAATPAQTGAADIVFQGKLYCSLTRRVAIPFKGVIQELKAPCGQPVTEGTVLARYKLDKENIAQIRRKLSPSQISELEMRLAEIDRSLAALGSKQRELKHLAAEKMAPALSLTQVEQEIQLLEKERASAQERLRQERVFAEEDTALVRHQLSAPVQANQVPDSGSLVAPMAGHVIWVHPDLKTGAELPAGTPGFVIGVMDPMIMRAKVHEIEAMRLSLGDTAEISIESIPGRKVAGVISRISWSTGTPSLDEPSFYEVELTVANPGFDIRDGLKGEAAMRTRESKDHK